MKARSNWFLISALCVAATARVSRSDEPPAGAATLPEGVLRFNFDLSNPNFSTLLNTSLLAGNGLGIDVAPPEAALRAQLGLGENSGLVVTSAPDESLGAKAGIKAHDVLVELNEQPLGDAGKFKELLDATEGQKISLQLLRAGKILLLETTPKNPSMSGLGHLSLNLAGESTAEERYRMGVTLSGTDEALRAQLRLAEGEGLVVTQVVPDGAAAAAGVERLDVLTVLDGKRLTTVEAINAQIQELKEKIVELRLLRAGKEKTVQIAPRKVREGTLAGNIVVWDTQDCRRCHADANATAHQLMGARLGATHSALVDAHRYRNALHHYYHYYQLAKPTDEQQKATSPQEQIEALKTQLGEMQKTLATLETALKPAEPKEK